MCLSLLLESIITIMCREARGIILRVALINAWKLSVLVTLLVFGGNPLRNGAT